MWCSEGKTGEGGGRELEERERTRSVYSISPSPNLFGVASGLATDGSQPVQIVLTSADLSWVR